MTSAGQDLLDTIVAATDAHQQPVRAAGGARLQVERDQPERGLTALVLAIVELLRQLMERQALRRMEHDDLSPDQLEDLGSTLMALEQQMTRLRDHFGLTEEDLNLDLGPLGTLLPRD